MAYGSETGSAAAADQMNFNDTESDTKMGLKSNLVRDLEVSVPARFSVHAYCREGSITILQRKVV